jgi:hypothetical protein
MQDRFERRREIFESLKGRQLLETASAEVLAKRTIRMVKMDSLLQGGSVRAVIDLGGRKVEYEYF